MTIKATVLAIGTELTTGQITNRNAAWLSDKMVELGFEVIRHETVPDDRPLIRDSLERCATESQVLLVCGGLGPTSDDFTREVIADWTGRPLEFDEAAWERIVDRLTGLGVAIPEVNRRQCWFPKGATIIPNVAGTASAFGLIHRGVEVWVFPGPPREVSAVWSGGIRDRLHALLPADLKRTRLLTWQCIGKSEAELSVLTEEALKGAGMLIGYRAHRPYVEIKVWCDEDEVESRRPWFDKLEAAIGPWVVTRQGADLAGQLLLKLSELHTRGLVAEIQVVDQLSAGALAERLAGLLRRPEFRSLAANFSLATRFTPGADPQARVQELLAAENGRKNALILALAGFSSTGEWTLGLGLDSARHEETRALAFGGRGSRSGGALAHELLERNRPLAAELALKQWNEWIDRLGLAP